MFVFIGMTAMTENFHLYIVFKIFFDPEEMLPSSDTGFMALFRVFVMDTKSTNFQMKDFSAVFAHRNVVPADFAEKLPASSMILL